jgi:hypothetical protein
MMGYYILLMAKRDEKLDPVNAIVVDLKLFDNTNKELVRNTDFALKNNRLYLLGDCAKRTLGKIFTMKDIYVDFNTSEDLLGRNVGLPYDNKLTKNEYREVAQMLIYAALGGPTIHNIKNAISTVSGMEGVQVFDKYTKDSIRSQYWSADRNDRLHEFDFLISLPGMYTDNPEKLQIFINYLKKIKPTDSDFFLSTLNPILDAYILKNKDKRHLDVTLYAYEFMESKDIVNLGGTYLTFKDVIDMVEQPAFVVHPPTFEDRMKITDDNDTIDSLKFIVNVLQNGEASDKILMRDDYDIPLIKVQMKDEKSCPGTQTLWLCDVGNVFDDDRNTCDNIDNFDYSKQIYFDRVNIITRRNLVLNSEFLCGQSAWNISSNATIQNRKLTLDASRVGTVYQDIKAEPNTKYIFNVVQSEHAKSTISYYNNSTLLGTAFTIYNSSVNNAFTTPNNCNIIRLTFSSDYSENVDFNYAYLYYYDGDTQADNTVMMFGSYNATTGQDIQVENDSETISPTESYNI